MSLLNSPFTLDQAERFAKRIERQGCENIAVQVEQAFQLALQRSPDDTELKAASSLVSEYGLAALCRALYNANEFLFLE